jgi:hypothetical protein
MIVADKPSLDVAFLVHFGVKGMKWGVRRDQRLSSSRYYKRDFVQKKDVYRVVAATGSRKLKDIAYVSTNEQRQKFKSFTRRVLRFKSLLKRMTYISERIRTRRSLIR